MENNPPAFPRTYSESKRGYGDQFYEAQDGMTLLDYFACRFAPSVMKQFPLMQPPVDSTYEEKERSRQCRRRFIAGESYELAKMFLTVRGNFDKDEGR